MLISVQVTRAEDVDSACMVQSTEVLLFTSGMRLRSRKDFWASGVEKNWSETISSGTILNHMMLVTLMAH